MLSGVFLVWLTAANALWSATIGAPAPVSLSGWLGMLFGTSAGWKLMIFGNLIGAGFALVVLAVTVVSFPLALDRVVTPVEAMKTSLRAIRANPLPMLAWGILVGALLLAGMIPLFIGLAVVLPWLGHATWHLYRRVVV